MDQTSPPSESLEVLAFAAPARAGQALFHGLRVVSGAAVQRYRVQAPAGVEHRVQVRYDAEGTQQASHGWMVMSDWSANPVIDIDQSAPGVYSLHLDLRADQEITAHFVGQTTAIDIGRLGQLCNQVAARVRRFHVSEPAYNWSPEAMKALGSIQALTEAVRETYPGRAAALRAATGALPDPVLLAVHAMNVVAGLYVFGHADVTRPGCVLNESEGPIVTAADYLASRIGCCLDFSCVLAAVLDALGVENRAVSIKRDHVFNEILVEGRRYTLDPSINTLYTRAYAEVLSERADAFTWPIPSLAAAATHRASLDALNVFLTIAADLYGPADLIHYDPKVVFADNYRILAP